ncbi:ATP-dependent endonuclease [Saccharospirillum alexandrii]|uniref:ATP-dependent nuclease n=1 Tax=Saccharospirillum alexandrii TaxID=2448477 RepID=UPI003736A2DD
MIYIEKLKLFNFKRFEKFEYIAREKRNILIGDNEAGKSSVLQAIDLVLTGNRSKAENLGLEPLFNRNAVTSFLKGDKNLGNLPRLTIEIYLNDHGNINLDGKNNSDDTVCHGLKMVCEPRIEEYGVEIEEALSQEDALFPYEYYGITFSTFSGQSYTQNRKFLRHLLLDSSLIGTEYATRIYTKSLFEANTDFAQRHKASHAYRRSKSGFTESSLEEINKKLLGVEFGIKSDSKSNLEQDLVITESGIPISQRGKGSQCFVKTDFALQQKAGSNPIDLILIEEPENHLSHLNMKRLINRIEKATQTQIVIATHSDNVCSRLDLHNASLLSASSNTPVSLSNLPDDTANYFIKAPNNKILEFILSERVVLVEGDAEYILMEGMYKNIFGDEPENSNIHIISVGGTSFKRYLDLAILLEKKTAVIRDNDGNYQENCIANYKSYVNNHIQVFYDKNNDRNTLEVCLFRDNEDLCERLFSPGRRALTALEYMLSNKSDSALKILKEGLSDIEIPEYISQALAWIKE